MIILRLAFDGFAEFHGVNSPRPRLYFGMYLILNNRIIMREIRRSKVSTKSIVERVDWENEGVRFENIFSTS